MSAVQGHTHDHGPRPERSVGRLKIALALTAIYMFAEAAGGWMANSLALLADAGHMFTDVAALSLTLFSFWFASRPATEKRTFGYYRAEILAAFVNGVVLVLLSVWVIWEAAFRWWSEPVVNGADVSIVALGGLAVNLIVLKLIHADHDHDLNMHGAWLHVIGDLLGSVAALVSGLLIYKFGWVWADAVTSILISVIIVFGAWRLVSDSINILLEGTPRHIKLKDVEAAIVATAGVTGVHDLHVWTISSGIDALSAHINHNDSVDHTELLATVRTRLHDQFGIDHLTIQIETAGKNDETLYVCESNTNCFEPARRHLG